jgi:uncharacterized phiE125 gp8 family phage protein
MGLKISVAPLVEPVSLADLQAHLRIDTGTFADEITSTVTIAPAAYGISSTNGASVDVLNKRALVQVSVGTVAAGAKLNCHIEESATGAVWTDWIGGTIPEITAAGTYELQYTGIKKYIRVVGAVTVDSINYSVSVLAGGYQTDEDTYLTSLISTARELCEEYQGRAYITRTYQYTLDHWPRENVLDLPMPPAIEIDSIVSTLTDGVTTTAWTNYQLDTSEFIGRLAPKYGYSWPTDTLQPLAGIKITYTAGYGATADLVPNRFKQAIMMLAGELYENREDSDKMQAHPLSWGVKALLGYDRVNWL